MGWCGTTGNRRPRARGTAGRRYADGNCGPVLWLARTQMGAPCGCGGYGCLEQYDSATAVARMAQELLLKRLSTLLTSRELRLAASKRRTSLPTYVF